MLLVVEEQITAGSSEAPSMPMIKIKEEFIQEDPSPRKSSPPVEEGNKPPSDKPKISSSPVMGSAEEHNSGRGEIFESENPESIRISQQNSFEGFTYEESIRQHSEKLIEASKQNETEDVPVNHSESMQHTVSPAEVDVNNIYCQAGNYVRTKPIDETSEDSGVLDISNSSMEHIGEFLQFEDPNHHPSHQLPHDLVNNQYVPMIVEQPQPNCQFAPLTAVPPARLPSIETAFSRLGEGFQTSARYSFL